MATDYADFVKEEGEIRQMKKEGYDFWKPDPNEIQREVVDFMPHRPPPPSLVELEAEEKKLAAERAAFEQQKAQELAPPENEPQIPEMPEESEETVPEDELEKKVIRRRKKA